MTSRNSFSNAGLLRDGMRRNLWAIVLAGLSFFLALVLPALMVMQRALADLSHLMPGRDDDLIEAQWKNALDQVATLIGGQNPLPKIVFIMLAIVCGVALFAYLHSRQKVDFYHSLPISRTRLYCNNFAVGLLCTLPVYLIMLGLTIVCVYAMGFGEAVSWPSIGGAAVSSLIIFLTLYALTVLTTVVCGHTVITLLLLLWVMFAPMLTVLMGSALCYRFFDTYDIYNNGLMLQAVRLSPLVQFFEMDGLQHTGEKLMLVWSADGSAVALLAIYLAVAVLAAVLGAYLFRRRRSERTGVALAFTPVELPVKVFICLFMGVAFGLLFDAASGAFWFWPGLVLGVVIFHWVVEIIYAFDFRAIFKHPVQLAVIVAVLIAGMLCFQFDVVGYDKWIPSVEALAAVDLDMRDGAMLEDPASIAAVQRLTEIGVAYGEQVKQMEQMGAVEDAETAMDISSYSYSYRLKSGRVVYRRFATPVTDEVRALRRQICSAEEYKVKKWALFRYLETYSDRFLEVYTNAGGYLAQCTINDAAQIEQIIRTLREEALANTERGAPVLRLQLGKLGLNHRQYVGNAYVTAADVKTLELIRQFTSVVPEALAADMVREIEITYYDSADTQTKTVTDQADIAALLENGLNVDAMELYRVDEPEDGACPLEELKVSLWVRGTTNSDTFRLLYPEGKAPTAVLDKYRPDDMPAGDVGAAGGAEAAEVIAVPTYSVG